MIIAANWKMNLLKDKAESLINSIKGYSGGNEIILCPPFTLLSIVSDLTKGTKFRLGAQNCHSEGMGAHTGDISAEQLADIGAKYVIVGHSERRRYNKDAYDGIIKKKAMAAINSGLTPIICIGETETEKNSGQTENIVTKQIEACIPKDKLSQFIIAYEPVWAIGTGKTPTIKEIEQVHALISSKLKGVKILYGGSVNDSNCAEIARIPNVSGFLVGGASLDAAKFTKIMNV